MDEAGFWTDKIRPRLIKHCQMQRLRHHFERIENAVHDGTPDVDYTIAGFAGKIELKFSDTHPRLPTSQVLGKGHGLRRSQIVYAARRIWAGGKVWALVGTPENTWLFDLVDWTPEMMDALSTASVIDYDRWAAWSAAQSSWALLIPLLAGRK